MGKWLIALILLTAPAAAADLAEVGPQAEAGAIIAAHGAEQGVGLHLQFEVSGGAHRSPSFLGVDLAAGYMRVRDEASDALYDYKLRRILWLDSTKRNFGNTSLYALADFRLAETAARQHERALLAAANIKQNLELLDPYWMQAELHVAEEAAPAIARSDEGGTAHFSYNGAEIASYALSAESLSAEERALFAHLLQERTTLHPSTIAALLAEGKLPQRLSFALPPSRKQEAEIWVLRAVSRAGAQYPLEPGFVTAPPVPLPRNATGSLALLSRLVPVMEDAVKGRAGHGPRSPADYRAGLNAAAGKGQWFAALLIALEAQEQYGELPPCASGETPCPTLSDIVGAGDARVAALTKALDTKDQAEAAKLLQAIDRAGVDDAYVLDGFIGNALAASGDVAAALPLLIAEVRGNPYVAGYYKDLGDLFRQGFAPDQAWLCYDLGRALPGGAGAPVIGTMNDYEARLAARAPQFF
jgi:hypothetical protein